MKRLLSLILSLASVGIITLSAEAKTAGSPAAIAAPQVRIQIGPRRRHARRVMTQTRIVHRGGQIYRETYRVMYLPNGMTRTRLIDRVRIR
jgi:hypothetical protein